MTRSHDLGRTGERLAASYLRHRGWSIVERNWRFHHKEIDLVVRRGGQVAFVEVKTREGRSLAHPLESITSAKRRDLATAARGWIALRGTVGESYRFDAVAVVRDEAGTRLEHVEDAWRP
jgi:putative endonuclease